MFHFYGLIVGLGALAGYQVTTRRLKKYRFTKTTFDSLLPWVVIGGIIGARIYHVIDLRDYYLDHPDQIVAIWNGGLGIFGAVAGGFFGLTFKLFILKKLNHLLVWADLLSPGTLLAQAIGRWGNFFNQEAYGFPTDLPWGQFISLDNRSPQFLIYSKFHPVFLYESIWSLLGVFILLKFLNDQKKKGLAFGFYLAWYGSARFFIEFLRFDTATIYGVKVAQVISLISIILGLFIIAMYRKSRTSVQ